MSHVKRDQENHGEAVEASQFLRELTEQIGHYAEAMIGNHPNRNISMSLFVAENHGDGVVLTIYGNVHPYRMIATFLARQAQVDEADNPGDKGDFHS